METGSWDYWVEIAQGLTAAVRLLVTGDPETWTIIRQSLLISVSATLASMVFGVPIGAWLAYASFRGRGVLLAICNTGFGLPPVVVGLILSILLLRHGPLGYLNLRFTPGAMIIGQFILSLPIVINLTVPKPFSTRKRGRQPLQVFRSPLLEIQLPQSRRPRLRAPRDRIQATCSSTDPPPGLRIGAAHSLDLR